MKRKSPARKTRPQTTKKRYQGPPRLSRKEAARRKRIPIGVEEILDTLKRKSPLGENLEQAKIWENWPTIIGAQLAPHCRPDSVRDGQLRIAVDSAVWMNRVNYQKWDIIRKVNRQAKKELIHDIFLVLLSEEEDLES